MRELEKQDIVGILENAREGILALTDGTRPYCLPLAFVYTNESIYVAIFPKGKKWEYFQKNHNACLNVLLWNSTRTSWASVIVDGEMEVVTDLGAIEEMVRANAVKMGHDAESYVKKRMEYYSKNIDNPKGLKILQMKIKETNGRTM